MQARSSGAPLSIGVFLEQQRLRHREERITSVLRALRADEVLGEGRHAPAGPRALAIHDFSVMLGSVRGRLTELEATTAAHPNGRRTRPTVQSERRNGGYSSVTRAKA